MLILRLNEFLRRPQFSAHNGNSQTSRSDKFETALEDYGRLHSANCDIFSKTCEEFYADVLSDRKRTQVFSEEFDNDLKLSLWLRLLRSGLNLDKIESIWLNWAPHGK